VVCVCACRLRDSLRCAVQRVCAETVCNPGEHAFGCERGWHPPHLPCLQGPVPDVYRGCYRGDLTDERIGRKYAQLVRAALEDRPHRVAAFICESVLGCAGQVLLPLGIPNLRRPCGESLYVHDTRAGGFAGWILASGIQRRAGCWWSMHRRRSAGH
jgi:hypothetical protein